MATMGSYCKAYPISRFQEFPGWSARPLPPVPDDGEEDDDAPLDEPYLFLQETLVVTDGIFLDERIVFDAVTPEWTEFCHATLGFSVPEIDTTPIFAADVKTGGTDERAGAEAVER